MGMNYLNLQNRESYEESEYDGFRCNLEIWHGLNNRITEEEADLGEVMRRMKEYRKNAIMFAGKHGCSENVLYCVIQHDEDLDIITTVSFFKDTFISQDELNDLLHRLPFAEYGIIYKDERAICQKAWEEEKSKRIGPITLKEANRFVIEHHRHHDNVTGCRFAIGLYKTVDEDDQLVGVAICGRPVSRYLDDGYTLEINRLCITEADNGCSMLYGACCRIAKEMGYRKIITYILESEPGISLKASNFVLEDECCGGANWTGSRKRKNNAVPEEQKQRWGRVLA